MPTTGHAKNAANFETVLLTLNNLGAAYSPSQSLIQPTALHTRLTAAKVALGAVDTAEANKKIAINQRNAEFDPLEKFVVNVKRAAEVDINDAAFTAELAAIVRKFRGDRASAAPEDDPATLDVDESKNRNAGPSRGFDSLIAYFADLIALLKTQVSYDPNEEEMKIAGLEARLAALEAKNNAAKTANAALGSAIDARDEVLYHPDTGVLKLVKLIKTQLSRTLGTDSAAYQQITALEFRKY